MPVHCNICTFDISTITTDKNTVIVLLLVEEMTAAPKKERILTIFKEMHIYAKMNYENN